MNFRRPRRDDPEINLIPLVDVLLVILIFLLVSTSFARIGALQVKLPTVGAASPQGSGHQIVVDVAADGTTRIGGQACAGLEALRQALLGAAAGDAQALVMIAADARATQQSVVGVMQAARSAGLDQIGFLTQDQGRP